jgi:putative N-acetyltransferase (TIGR04045 family)
MPKKTKNGLEIREALLPEEKNAALSIREAVFVHELGMFAQSDADENDRRGHHLIALVNGEIAGTVRIYRDGENGCWVGGRLAVKQGFRKSLAGRSLVREAVNLARRKKAGRFYARIQTKNAAFFERLGWKKKGPVFTYKGRPHRIMEADLSGRKG